MSEEKRYISYFQSVITIGLLDIAKTPEEAAEKAKNKFDNKDGVNHCFFDQTNFELAETAEWNPQFEPEETIDGFRFAFNPTDEIKNVIATRMHKEITSLTEQDYAEFVKNSIENSLKPS